MHQQAMIPQHVNNHLLAEILSDETHDALLDSFSPDDWELIVRHAQAEGVASLLYWKLIQSEKVHLVPDVLRDSLRALYYSLRMNNGELVKESNALAGRFATAGIPVIALKGICFALTIYPDPALRPMGDIDLLVPASRFHDAMQIAKGAGYIELVPEAFPGTDDLLSHAIGLQKQTSPFTVLELHSSLVAQKGFAYAVPMDWFWTQTEAMPRVENLLMLTPTAQVLYASAHAMLQHGARDVSLRWFYDIDCLIRTYAKRMDWDVLLSQAGKFQWRSAVSAAFSQTINFFDTPIPHYVLTSLSAVADANAELITAYREYPATHTLEEFQKLKSLNWRARIKMILALVIPSPAYMRWRYNMVSSWVLPFYYFHRWLGILKDIIRTFITLISKRISIHSHAENL